jgi:O-antigen/teichoic acid export membrane protein
MLFGTGSKLLYALTRLALPPLALAHVGLAEYGLWAVCFVLVAYLGMAASGFTLVYLRRVAELHGRGDTAAIGRLLSTGILSMAALAAALFGALWLAMPALLQLFRVDAALRPLATTLWLGTCAVFLADMSLGAFANVLHAVGRVRHEQVVWIAAFVLETVLIVALLYAGLGIHALLAAFALRYLFACSANAALAWRALPGLRLSPRAFDPALLRALFTQGSAMQASALVASVLQSSDRVLAGALIGPQATALVDLAGKLPTTAASLGSGISTVAVSAAARHDVQGRDAAVREVYGSATRLNVAVLGAALPFLAWFADPIALAWLGASATQAGVAPLLLACGIAVHAHVLTGPVNAVRRGCGRLDGDFVYHGLRVLGLGAAVAAWWALGGGVGALVGWMAAGGTLAAGLFLAGAHRHVTGGWAGLVRPVLVPSLAAHALAAGLAQAAVPTVLAGRVEAFAVVATGLAVWLPAVAALLALSLLGGDERRQLLRRLRARRAPAWSHP